MDRNLGGQNVVIRDQSGGFFYQFGRKDPFPRYNSHAYNIKGEYIGNGYSTINFSESISRDYCTKFPNRIIWNEGSGYIFFSNPYINNPWDNPDWYPTENEKSLFDPCPVGWKVPKGGVWNGIVKTINADVYLEGSSYYLSGEKSEFGEKAWYPRTGHKVGGTGDRTAYSSSTPAGESCRYYLRMGYNGNNPDPNSSSGFNGWVEGFRSGLNQIRCIQE